MESASMLRRGTTVHVRGPFLQRRPQLARHPAAPRRQKGHGPSCAVADPATITDGIQTLQTFEPRLSPAIAVAAAAAAVPPIVFWGRVFLNATKRLREQSEAEEERQRRVEKLTGNSPRR